MKALFKGAGANSFQTLGSALVLVLYDEIKAMVDYEAGWSISSRLIDGIK
jgi:hypothetical protein